MSHPDTAPMAIAKPERHTAPVLVTAKDLQGHGVIVCPNPRMPLWSNHPRVFIDVAKHGEGRCPYCGTVYRLEGPVGHGH